MINDEEILNNQVKICNILKEDNKIRAKLNALIYDTRNKRRENALKICINDKQFTTDSCSGIECAVPLKKTCPNGTKEISFHTHPPTYDYIPSNEDFLEVSRVGHDMFCIGHNELYMRNYVNCYKIPDDLKEKIKDIKSAGKKFYEAKEKQIDSEKLIKLELIYKHARRQIAEIEYMSTPERVDYSKKNRLCRIVVSTKL